MKNLTLISEVVFFTSWDLFHIGHCHVELLLSTKVRNFSFSSLSSRFSSVSFDIVSFNVCTSLFTTLRRSDLICVICSYKEIRHSVSEYFSNLSLPGDFRPLRHGGRKSLILTGSQDTRCDITSIIFQILPPKAGISVRFKVGGPFTIGQIFEKFKTWKRFSTVFNQNDRLGLLTIYCAGSKALVLTRSPWSLKFNLSGQEARFLGLFYLRPLSYLEHRQRVLKFA